ncbi:hypothetical protein ACG04R_02260 [Roseateles sp. BYS78W]|uniref:Uncharacterized protein n=1 Tax=Pelomonas candidula TaxID=3299025 RepID=A0ABW7H6U9_9BURK
MATSARFKFTATLVVSVLGFVMTLVVLPSSELLNEPLALLAPPR